jgi:hypothetical protein
VITTTVPQDPIGSNGVDGWLVEAGSSEAIKRYCRNILERAELIQQVGAAAQNKMRTALVNIWKISPGIGARNLNKNSFHGVPVQSLTEERLLKAIWLYFILCGFEGALHKLYLVWRLLYCWCGIRLQFYYL